MTVDPETEICVTCGSTEAMIASMLGVLDPGDEIVVFEPFYENYGPDSIIAGAVPRLVSLRPPDWTFDEAELRAAFGPRTRAIVINTPNNPTGKVFTREELAAIAELCVEHDAIAITDEIYEHITYDEAEHVPIATLPGMAERTITISALSKTYSVTGWRVGWAIAAAPLMAGIRPVHDFLTVAAAAPLQVAGITALQLPPSYFERMRADYAERRERDAPGAGRERLRGGVAAPWRVLRDGRLLPPRARRRRGDRAPPRGARRRGDRARLVVRLRSRRRGAPAAVRVLQARRDAGGGGGAAQPTVSDAAMSSGPGSSGFIVCGRQYRT